MYPIDRRSIAIRIYNNLQSLRKVGILLGVCHTTIMRWVKQPFKVTRKQVKSLKSTQIVDSVKACILSNPLTSVRKIQHLLEQSLNVKVSRELVRIAIKRLGYSHKKAKFFPSPKIGLEVTSLFLEARERFKSEGKIFLAIDETSFGRNGLQTKGYSKKGEKLHVTKINPTMISTSVVACVSTSSLIAKKQIKGSFNADMFLDFLKTLKLSNQHVIVMDNVRFHHTKKVKEYLESLDVSILFTPPYSPWFNPIEMAFSIVKRHFVNFQNIERAFESLTSKHLLAFFNKSLDAVERF